MSTDDTSSQRRHNLTDLRQRDRNHQQTPQSERGITNLTDPKRTLRGAFRGLSSTQVQKHIDSWNLHHLTRDKPVLNLSGLPLSDNQINLLAMGSKFCMPQTSYQSRPPPTQPAYSSQPVHEALKNARATLLYRQWRELPYNDPWDRLSQRIQWAWLTKTQTPKEPTPFLPPSENRPPKDAIPTQILDIIQKLRDSLKQHQPRYTPHPNTPSQWKYTIKQLRSLINNNKIIIKPADKGSCIVVMDPEAYLREGFKQLSNTTHYRSLEQMTETEWAHQSSTLVQKCKESLEWFLHNGHINCKQFKHICPKPNARPRRLYLLPKIHKNIRSWTIPGAMPPGRPIISDTRSMTYQLAKYIDRIITPFSITHQSYIKDTEDFLNKLKNTQFPNDAILATMDIVSLYTNINNSQGVQAVRSAMAQHYKTDPDNPYIEHTCNLLQLCLTNNTFQFHDVPYIQTSGAAMGHCYSPRLADIFMAKLEEIALSKINIPILYYCRFLDDIFLVFQGDNKQATHIQDIFNSLNSSIKFTIDHSADQINFLDVTIFKGPGFRSTGLLDTKIYRKPTDTRSLLHTQSFHPPHVYNGIVKSQLIRYNRICSSQSSFNQEVKSLFKTLKTRGYSNSRLRRLFAEWKYQIKYNPWGSYPCNQSKCIACNTGNLTTTTHIDILNPLPTDTPPQIQPKPIRLPHHANCNTKGIIYLIQCNVCLAGYVGYTLKNLATRYKQHITRQDYLEHRATTTDHNRSRLLHCHFSDCGDIRLAKLTILDTIPPKKYNNRCTSTNQEPLPHTLSPKQILLSKEAWWIAKLGTSKHRGGLNMQSPNPPPLFPFIIPYCSNHNQFSTHVRQAFQELAQFDPKTYGLGPLTAHQIPPNNITLFTKATHPEPLCDQLKTLWT